MVKIWIEKVERSLRFWGIFAPFILISLCVFIGISEGFIALWNSSVLPALILIAFIIFLTSNITSLFLRIILKNYDNDGG